MKRAIAWLLALTLLCVSTALADPQLILRSGSRGSEVIRLQTVLRDLGLYTKALDGVYGRGTVAAVRAYQRQNGLKADGVAGPLTLAKLYAGSETEQTETETETVQTETETETVQTETETAPQYPELRSGSRGSAVTKLQKALKKLGLYAKALDGVYGRGTEAAVRSFQQRQKLPATGTADSATQAALYAAAKAAQTQSPIHTPGTLRLGDSGDAVAQLQTKLRYVGWFTGAVSGTFDADTRAAVIAFQQAKRLEADGVAGKKTLSALDKACDAARQAAGGLPDEAVAFLNALAVRSGTACGTVQISRDGQTILSWSFGGVSNSTCFRIASVTKWVTAIGLMTLVDQGKLDLDRDVSEYLPFVVRNPAWPDTAITARMLLSHTSSLSPDAQEYHPNWAKIGVNGYDPLFDEAVQPGTRYAYADYNGALFGCLIEAITGESVQTYLDRAVFKPLGLTAAYTPRLLPSGTATKDLLDTKGRVAISVAADRNRAFSLQADPIGNNGYTVGKLYINAASLTRLAQMMLGGGELDGVRILKPETVALMEADQPGLAESKYGLSTVRHGQFARGVWYGHQGRYSGLTSNIYYQRETGLTLALVMDGYDFQLEDNIVMPAVNLLKNMETLEALCAGAKE